MATLFDPLTVGELTLPNRIIMAPLTRSRAGVSRIPNALMAEYYSQRASAGLIISEATVVSPMGIGYADTPGIWSDEQVDGWKLTTRAVHEAGGRIFLQLWHVGRASDPSFLNGALPEAPSAIAIAGNVSLIRPPTPYVTPRALERSELPGIIEAFRRGADNAQRAGFDGVELHGANGYLLDQFLQDSSNKRGDDYGGPIENRARLMLEVTDALVSVWGRGRVAVHLAPRADVHSMGDSNLRKTFEYVAERLGERKIAFLCSREHWAADRIGPALKKAFGGVYVVNEKFTQETASVALQAGDADAVAFGKLFIANPDLPARFASGAPLNEPRMAEFYAGGANGYTDYPVLNTSQARVNARVSSGV
jgi:2,4-dienoyl-CoA reductase-like NADH-dependent reductase (Old Yellow Enzyme family)